VTGFLFFAYPSPARLIEITSANITRLMNEARADANVDPLASNSLLASAAMAKGEDMIVRQYFAHDTPDGKRPWQWIDRTQYDYVYAGENLAMGFITAESAHDALMKSPTHRKNILNPRYRDLGIAVVSGNMNGFPSQILVQFFGTQRSQIVTAVARADTVAPAPAPAPVPTSALPNPDLSSQPAPAPVPAPAPKPPVAQPAPAPAPAPTPTPPAPAPAPAPTPAPLPPAPPTTVASLTTTPEPASPELPASSQSPEEVLAEGSQNDTVLLVHFDQGVKKPVVESVIEYSNIFFLAFLIFLFISLVLNIFIKIRVQHADLIFQTIVVIALIASMALIKLNYVEQIAPQLLIL